MRSRTLFSNAGPGLPACGRPVPRRLVPLLAPVILAAALGCREDAASPTAPESTAPALTITATAALAFSQVSAGLSHSCGVTSDNRAYCWGYNGGGQLGDGTQVQRLTPVAVGGGLSFRQVSVGFSHTCGLTTDYRAYCWGANNFGGLGDGTSGNLRLTPFPVSGGHQFRQIDAGGEHTCGTDYLSKRAYCWGWNDYGQIGDGTTTSRLVPVPVAGSHSFRQVSAGPTHTCGVTPLNAAFCWGSNRFGQIGDSSTAVRRVRPVLVAGGHQVHQVDAGGYHTCAVTTDNRAYCWGNGRYGELGNGKSYLSFWPRAVVGGLYFTRVSAGWHHSCGVTTDDRAYCWGFNRFGQLGDGTTTQRLTPVAVTGGLSFAQVSAGDEHTCGKTSAAVAYCWGYNAFGQFGDGTTTDRLTPVAVAGAM